MDIKTLIAFCLIFYSSLTYANYPLPRLLYSGGLAYSQFSSHPDRDFKISNYVTDRLSGFNQRHFPSLMFSVKNEISFKNSFLDSIDPGLAFYYQKMRYKGDVWELQSPQFNNYTYDYTAENFSLMLENDFYFHPWCEKFYPYIVAGIGIANIDVSYEDKAQSNIPSNTELSLTHTQIHLSYLLGVGVTYLITDRVFLSLRYHYMNAGNVDTGTDTNIRLQEPIKARMNSHNVFLILSYSVKR